MQIAHSGIDGDEFGFQIDDEEGKGKGYLKEIL